MGKPLNLSEISRSCALRRNSSVVVRTGQAYNEEDGRDIESRPSHGFWRLKLYWLAASTKICSNFGSGSPVKRFICSDELNRHVIGLWLVGALEHDFYDFPFSWECHHPTDELTPSFFRGVGRSTTNQWSMMVHVMFPGSWSWRLHWDLTWLPERENWRYGKDGPAKSDKPPIWDGWNPRNHGMFTTVFNWCRISQPSTVCSTWI